MERREFIEKFAVAVGGMVLVPSFASSIAYAGFQKFPEHTVEEGTAKIKFEIFSDFQCPACAMHSEMLYKLREAHYQDTEFRLIHDPLAQHPNAYDAAKASECARDQGDFWRYAHLLYHNQKLLGKKGVFFRMAGSLGLDVNKFKKAFEDNDGIKKKLIAGNKKEAKDRGVLYLPSFFIQGTYLGNEQEKSFENLSRIIEQELAKVK